MFGRKEKAAIAALPPQHQALINQQHLAVTQSPADWLQLFQSLANHNQTVHKHPLPLRTMDVLMPLVRVLSEDMEPTAGLGVRADLRGPEVKDKLGPAQPLPSNPPISHLEEIRAWDPWLVIEAPLRDGSDVVLTVVDMVRTRKYRKRSASGKIKFKRKAKASQRVSVKLTLPRGREVAAPPPSNATNWLAVTAKPKNGKQVVLARGKYPYPTTPQPGWQLNTLMLVLAEVFRWVVPLPDEPGGASEGAAS